LKTIAFFNNKGGVGKTTLVYHLAHMLPRIGYPTLAVDLDPQANLTSAFFDEDRLEELWEGRTETILACVDPILEGVSDITSPVPLDVAEDLWVIAGDLGLSRFEDRLSSSWPGSITGDPSRLRTTSAFHRIVAQGGEATKAAAALLDVGPNLGAINRAALLAADFLVIPLAADLFSLQGLRNLGPTLRRWKKDWDEYVLRRHQMSFELHGGRMTPAGYIILQRAVRLDRPVRAYARWIDRIPSVYREEVLDRMGAAPGPRDKDEHCLATLRNFRSLMPMAQEARKPMFDLAPADGAIGSHAQLARTCETDFRRLAERIAGACGLTRAR
jgi:cellulose biosynthesis protein BcsQ